MLDGKFRFVADAPGRLPDSHEAMERGDDESILRLARPRRLSGRVTRGSEGVAGVVVEGEGEHRKPKATTDARGRFAFEGLRPGTYQLKATDGAEAATASVEVLPSTDKGDVELSLKAAGGLAGSVTDESGKPVPDASVEALGDAGRGSARADAKGRYRVVPLNPGTYHLEVEANGFVTQTLDRDVVGKQVATADVKLVHGARVAGLVVDEAGEPVHAALVGFFDVKARGLGSGHTDEKGHFELREAPAGPHSLEVHADGYWRTKQAVDAPNEGLRIVLGRGLGIRGRVSDEDGLGVEGVRVMAAADFRDDGPIGSSAPRPSTGKTDKDGRFALWGLATGKVIVSANEEGTGRTTTARAVLAVGTPAEVNLTFVGRLRIEGRVVDENQQGVEGAYLSAQPHPTGEKRLDPRERRGGFRSTRSEADGRFAFKFLTAGAFYLRVNREGFEVETPEASASAGDQDVVLRVKHMPTVHGRVLGPDQAPVENYRVAGQRTGAHPGGLFEIAASSAGDAAVVSIEAPGFAPLVRRIAMEGRRSVDAGDLVLEHGRALEGQVVDATSGAPVAGAAVVASLPETGEGIPFIEDLERGRAGGSGAFATTDADGHFELDKLPGGELQLSVTHDSYRRTRVAGGASPMRITLDPGARVDVTVISADGRPVVGAMAVLVREAGVMGSGGVGRTDGNGLAHLGGLPAGTSVLRIAASEQLFPTDTTVTLADHETKAVTIRELSGGATVRVSVTFASGEATHVVASALPGDVVTAGSGALDLGLLRKGTMLRRDPDNRDLLWKHAPAGHFTLLLCVAEEGGLACEKQALDVSGTDEQHVEVRLPEHPAIRLTAPKR